MANPPPTDLTFLFSDIEGSTRLVTRLGDAFQAVHADHQRLLRAAWQVHGGEEINTEGDSFFVVFPTARAAILAAADAHRSLAAHRWPPDTAVKIRIGVHTGRAVRVGDDYLGLDVHRAARVAAAGHGGQTLVSEAAHDAVAGDLPTGLRLRDLGRHRLKDVGVQRLWQLDVEGLPSSFRRLRSLDAHPSNVPAGLTTLVDREAESADVAARLGDGAVVTVTGPGGIGKSRIAIRVARDAVEAFPDGVFYLDVAAIDGADRVAERLLEILELPADPGAAPRSELVALLAGRTVLLVLDNGDRVADLAGLVAGIANACTLVRILVTSRSPLRIGGEREVAVGPLALPPEGAAGVDAIRASDAVALFVRRAQEIQPAFGINASNAGDIAEICRRLDGLPLAIELAAARTRVLPVAALRERLARRLPLLAGGARDAPDRQRTMRAAIAWSYELLDERERALLEDLSVFEGPFELAAAEAVAGSRAAGAGDVLEVLEVLEALVERSLVARAGDDPGDGDGEPLFRLLGTIREFAREMLEQRDDADAILDAHLRHWLAWVRAELARTDLDDVRIGARIERHAADYAAALERALADPASGSPARVADALALAAALGRHWWLHGHLRDGAAWLERALAATGGPGHPDTGQARYWAGVLHEGSGNDELARRRLEESLELAVAAGDQHGVSRALNSLGVVARSGDDPDQARSLLTRALAINREQGDRRGTAITLSNLGIVEIDQGRPADALPFLEEAVALDRAAGSRVGAAYSLLAYGAALAGVGRRGEAVAAISDSVETFADLRDPEGVADGLDELASMVATAGDATTAMRLYLAADALRLREGVRLRPVDRRQREPRVEAARSLVDPATLGRLASESVVIDVDAAVALARAAAHGHLSL